MNITDRSKFLDAICEESVGCCCFVSPKSSFYSFSSSFRIILIQRISNLTTLSV